MHIFPNECYSVTKLVSKYLCNTNLRNRSQYVNIPVSARIQHLFPAVSPDILKSYRIITLARHS